MSLCSGVWDAVAVTSQIKTNIYFLLKYLNHSQIVLKHFSLFSLIGIEIEIEIVL